MTDKLTPPKQFVHLSNARLPEQEEVMKKIQEDGVCPFCADNLSKYHKNPILLSGEYWVVTKNQWPYNDTKNHFLAITKEHVDDFLALPPEAGKELIELFQKISRDFNVAGGGLAMRVGSGGYASSVAHLHCHFIEPDLSNPNHKAVKFPLSKDRGGEYPQ